MILDSNLIIDASRPEYSGLRHVIRHHAPGVSAISVLKVLGYHKLLEIDRVYFERFFAASEILPLNDAVIETAVSLRQTKKRSVGDSLVAATALVFGRELLTHNIKDFTGIPGLSVSDPLQIDSP